MKKSTLILLLAILGLSSCEMLTMIPGSDTDPHSVFNYLWTEVDELYSFFDVKDVDWDDTYSHYDTLINANTSDDTLFIYLAEMLNRLRDGHVNLVSDFNVSRFDITHLGPENINVRLLEENYLKDDYYSTGPFRHNFLHSDSIGYIYYNSFSNTFDSAQLDFIFKRYNNTQGLILDLRQNGGGNLYNIFSILNRFSREEKTVYTTCIKNGPDHEDFTDSAVVSLVPAASENFETYSGPVAVLIDRGSYSASSFFSVCTKAFDHITLLGDTTGGGLGGPNGGQLPNGWTYRMSITRTLSYDGINYENGVPPEIVSILDPAQVALGKDNVIEDAVHFLINQ